MARARTRSSLRSAVFAVIASAGALATAAGCRSSAPGATPHDWPAARATRTSAGDPLKVPEYAPFNVPDDWSGGLLRGWLNERMLALAEPSFEDSRNRHSEAYRCVSGAAWRPDYVVRAVRTSDGGMLLFAKVTAEGRCRARPRRWTSRGTPEQWTELVRQADHSGLWSDTTPRTLEIEGCDGWEWIFEGLKDGRHEAMAKWAPKSGDPIYAPCVYLFALAGVPAELDCD